MKNTDTPTNNSQGYRSSSCMKKFSLALAVGTFASGGFGTLGELLMTAVSISLCALYSTEVRAFTYP
jgi:hypothetical protein